MRGALTCAAAATLAMVQPAHAQVAGSLSLTSDYRVRGVSFSDRRPALSLSLSDDLANGVYLGATAWAQDAPGSRARLLGHQEYLGYAGRVASGQAWEVGLDNQHYEGYGRTPLRLDYSEAYAGLSDGRFSSRLYFSPNYNGSRHRIAYFETNAAFRPAEGWRLTGHVGVLQALNRWRGFSMKPRYDARVDVVRKLGPAEVSVGWASATPATGPDPRRSRGAVIVAASLYF